MIAGHVDKAAVHREVLHLAASEEDAGVALRECAKEGNVAAQERDLTTFKGARDHLRGLARKQHALGRHHFDAEGTGFGH